MEYQKTNSYLSTSERSPFIYYMNAREKNTSDTPFADSRESINLLYISKGTGMFFYDGLECPVTAGDIAVIHSGAKCRIISESVLQYHCFEIDYVFCQENGIHVENIFFHTPISDKQAKKYFSDAVQELETSLSFKNAGMKVALLNLLLYLARNHAQTVLHPNPAGSAKDENIRRAIRYINSNVNERLSIDDIARKAGLSKFYFLREFKKITGETVISYINKTRCENAKKMLRMGSYSIKEVSERNGFDDASYFSKNFKRFTGETPLSFIRKNFTEK